MNSLGLSRPIISYVFSAPSALEPCSNSVGIKYFILLTTPINTTHHVLSAHTQNLAQYLNKVVNIFMRAAAGGVAWSSTDTSMLQRTGYVLYRPLVYNSIVCAHPRFPAVHTVHLVAVYITMIDCQSPPRLSIMVKL